jgi:hypothetical protein
MIASCEGYWRWLAANGNPYPEKSHSKCSASAPEAKVVLSVRDGRAWARSMHDTIWGVLYDEQSIVHHLAVAQGRIDQAMSAYTELMADMINRADLFGSTPTRFDEDALVAGMERHNAAVRAAVPAGRILEWSPADAAGGRGSPIRVGPARRRRSRRSGPGKPLVATAERSRWPPPARSPWPRRRS